MAVWGNHNQQPDERHHHVSREGTTTTELSDPPRYTGDRGVHRADRAEVPEQRGESPAFALSRPVHRTILAVDIESSTERTNVAKALLRHVMYRMVEESLDAAGLAGHHEPLLDRGDGVVALIRPVDEAPKTALLDTVIPTLARLLVDYRAQRPDWPLRLRTVVHAGEVHNDGRGFFGEALDLAFRLLNASEVKETLLLSAEPLVLVVSEDIYWSVVVQGYEGIDARDFHPMVRVTMRGREYRGWVRGAPGPTGLVPELGLDTGIGA